MSNDTVNPETIDPQTPAAPELDAGDPPGGAQPASEPTVTTPPPDVAGSDHIPRSRFNEVIAERNRERAEKAQLMAALQQRQQAEPNPQKPSNSAPKEADYENFQDFQDARAAYIADQRYEQRRMQERQAEQQQQEQSRVQAAEQNWTNKAREAADKYPDFDQKINSAPPITNAYALAVLKKADAAGDLAYHLAGDHALIAKINGMHPLDAAMELGRIEVKLAGSKTPPKQSVSKAPPPISPVGSGKTNSAQAFTPGMTQEEFNAAFKPIW